MQYLVKEIVELIRLTSTDLPAAVEYRLVKAAQNEARGSAAKNSLETILKNISLARQKGTPLCQDTGTPIFYVKYPQPWRQIEIIKQIKVAVEKATRQAYLRPNAVNARTGQNSGNNVGEIHFPEIFCEEVETDELEMTLMLKGGGCENVSAQYSLPDTSLSAERDLEGVRRVVLDAIWRAQGEGCAPGFLGVAIGGDRAASYMAAKTALLRPLDQPNPDSELSALEKQITREANSLNIGPMGVGGRTTLLDTHITCLHRVPASYFVSVAYMCWAFRCRKMTVREQQVTYE